MSAARRQLVLDGAAIAVALTAHWVLWGYLADGRVALALLTGQPGGSAVAVFLFVLLRLFLVLVVPGYLLARLVLLAWPRVGAERGGDGNPLVGNHDGLERGGDGARCGLRRLDATVPAAAAPTSDAAPGEHSGVKPPQSTAAAEAAAETPPAAEATAAAAPVTPAKQGGRA